ncbi:MAG: MFS transporter [Actinomycetota bacterium]|nr:MFS transporter [Actinomycetota bacterium]MDQ2956224.1 MFS transporter [Actinomycetota bacterium]
MTVTTTQPDERVRGLGLLTLVLAAACGLSVANIYYSQPLLDLIAKSFHTSQSGASVVVTATQLGYAAGLILLLPLGDLLENRTLTARTMLGTAVVALLAAVAPNLASFLILSVLIGFTSVVAQILVPLAAQLAPEAERGHFVGRVMSGLLLGILLARTVSSLLAAAWGWRSVYLVSAGLMLVMAGVLLVTLPRHRPEPGASYRQLMASIGGLVRTEPALRRRAVCQALMFATFSTFWTSITFELIKVHRLSQVGIAIFALVGAAGALAAPIAGRLADRGHGRIASGLAFVLALAAMALAGLAAHHLFLLALAGVLLDLAVQGHQVLSQQEIYQLRPDARARINTVFMGTVFLAGSIASATSGLLYEHFGWTGPASFGAALAGLGWLVWAGSEVLRRTGSRSVTSRPSS